MKVFVFAEILYVDSTNLLMCDKTPTTPDKKFFGIIQQLLDKWVGLISVVCGSLKPSKYHTSINCTQF